MRLVIDGDPRLQASKAAAKLALNDMFNAVRCRYVSPLAGQDFVYAQKVQDAAIYLSRAKDAADVDMSDLPFLTAEMHVNDMTADQTAQVFLNNKHYVRTALAELEYIRADVAIHLLRANTVAQVDACVAHVREVIFVSFGRDKREAG